MVDSAREAPPGWKVVNVIRLRPKCRFEADVDDRGRIVLTVLEQQPQLTGVTAAPHNHR